MHPAIIIGTVRSLIVDVAMGQIPRSTERISSSLYNVVCYDRLKNELCTMQRKRLSSRNTRTTTWNYDTHEL